MTYGNEAVLFPVADLYDQGAMQMYIEAAKDQYNRGQKAIDDFVAKYGDFTSPIAADIEYWDNNTMTPIIDMYDEYVMNGIDPVRNPEARNSLMARARRLPYAKLAAIRQNAEDAREYRKAQQKLIQEGKYDNRFAKYDNVDLSTFRTIGDDGNVNTIGQLSPTPILPIGQFADPFFGDIKPRTTKTSENGVTVESEVLSQQDIMNYTNAILPQVMNTAQGKLMYDTRVGEYKNAGYDEESAKSMAKEDIRDNIAASQMWRITNNQSYDDGWKEKDASAQGWASLGLQQQKIENNSKKDPSGSDQSGYSTAEDLYVTSLAKASGVEYLPENGVNQETMAEMLRNATEKQNKAIKETKDVLTATGMRVSPQKVAGLIQHDGKNGRGYFLNASYLKNLHDLQDLRSSYKGWMPSGATKEEAANARQILKQRSVDIVNAAANRIAEVRAKDQKKQYGIKVVPVEDGNHNNVYGMVGDDGRWHTYALVRVYISDGAKSTIPSGGNNEDGVVVDMYGNPVDGNGRIAKSEGDAKKEHFIPQTGRLMALEIGLRSNVGTANPDLSVSAMEELGYYPFDATKKRTGLKGNKDFPYGRNVIDKDNTQSQ